MTTDSGSATIYMFPARGRFAALTLREEMQAVAKAVSPRVARAVSGGAWYHEEAIRDAEPTREK